MSQGKLITLAARLLPAEWREWADAMTAELDEIPFGIARRRFARGCVAAIVLRALELRVRIWLGHPAWLLFAFAAGILIALLDRAAGTRAYMWMSLLSASAVAGWCRPAASWRWGFLLAAGIPLLAAVSPAAGPYGFDRVDALYGLPPAILVSVLASLGRGRLRARFLLLLLALPLSTSSAAQTRSQDPISRLTVQDLSVFADSMLRDYLRLSPEPSLAFVVVKDDAIVFARGYGSEDPAGIRPVDPDGTVFWMASLSKLLTADAIMREQEQGRLELNASADRYLGWALPVRNHRRQVTVQDLLTHTSGLDEPFMLGTVDDPSRLTPLNDYLRSLRWRAGFSPGEVLRYSNHGMALAGAIVERSTGLPFPEYVERRIFEPLGMKHSTFRQPMPAELAARVATAGTDGRIDYLLTVPAGAMMSTAADMGRFLIAQLDTTGPQRDALRRAHSTQWRLHPGVPGVALGWFETSIGDVRGLYHTGARHHFSVAWIAPQERTGVFLVHSMRQGGPFKHLRSDVIRAFAQRYLTPDAALVPNGAAQSTGVGGVYRPLVLSTGTVERVGYLFLDTTIRVGTGGVLILKPPGLEPIEALPSGGGRYVVDRGPQAGMRVGVIVNNGVARVALGGSLVDPLVLVRLSWWERGAVHAACLGLGSVALIVAALIHAVRGLRRHRHPLPAELRRAWAVITAAGLLLLAAPVAFLLVVALTPEAGAAEHLRRGLHLVLPLFTIAAALAGCIPVLVGLSRLRGTGPSGRVLLTACSLAGPLVAGLLWHYRLVGIRL